MPRSRPVAARFRALTAALASLLVLLPSAASSTASQATPTQTAASDGKVLLFAADGMRQDLAERYAAAGAMPAFAEVLQDGVRADGGLLQAFPRTRAPAGRHWRPAPRRRPTAR